MPCPLQLPAGANDAIQQEPQFQGPEEQAPAFLTAQELHAALAHRYQGQAVLGTGETRGRRRDFVQERRWLDTRGGGALLDDGDKHQLGKPDPRALAAGAGADDSRSLLERCSTLGAGAIRRAQSTMNSVAPALVRD